MKKFWIQIGILILVILSAFYVSYNPQSFGNFSFIPSSPKQQQININNTVIDVGVADTPSTRQAGLSGKQEMAKNQGMLFVFQETKKYQFWMKGMNFPLDFIFIANGRVVDVLLAVPPPVSGQQTDLPVYEPTVPIDMMLEVNAGFIDSHNIKVGDTVFQIK